MTTDTTHLDARRSQAVLIGVSEHVDERLPGYRGLEYGVHKLGRLLRDPEIWGLPEENLHIVSGADATESQIGDALLAAAEAAEDILFVYYGGHGYLDRHGAVTRLYLPAYEAEWRYFFRWREFEWLRQHLCPGVCQARYRMLLLDSCHSGTALEHGALSASADSWSDIDRVGLSTLMTACEKFEEAKVPDGEGFSVFAAALIDTLESGIDSSASALSADDVYRAVRARIGHGQQTPRILNADGAGDTRLFGNRRGHARTRVRGLATIPLAPSLLVGREAEIGFLVEGARRATDGEGPFVGVVHGRGGIGKSAIAQTAASQLSPNFPLWRLYVDLHTWTSGQRHYSPAKLLENLLQQAGQQCIPTDLSDRASRWHSWLAGHKALIVLEDVESTEQIRQVLPPAAADCAVLVTSRNRLSDLPATCWVTAAPLPADEAVILLRSRAKHQLANDDLVALAEAVGRVPKALDVLSVQLTYTPPRLLLDQIREAGSDALAQLHRAALARLDSDELRTTAYACGFHPGPDFNAHSIAAITRGPSRTTAQHLHQLAQHRLIEPLPGYRFGLHDEDTTVARSIACLDNPDGLNPAQARLITWLHYAVDAAGAQLWGHNNADNLAVNCYDLIAGPGAAIDWLYAAESEVITAITVAVTTGHPNAIELTQLAARWLRLTDRYDQSEMILEQLSIVDDNEARTTWHTGLGNLARLRGDLDTAQDQFQMGLSLAEIAGDRIRRADALWGLGEVALLRGEFGTAEERYHLALGLAEISGDRIRQADSLDGLGELARLRGDFGTAEERYHLALGLTEAAGTGHGQANALRGLGTVGLLRGDLNIAESRFHQTVSLAEATGDRIRQANALDDLGAVARMRGDWDTALEQHRKSLRLAGTINSRIQKANALQGLGWAYVGSGRPTEARVSFYKARDSYLAIGNHDGARRCQDAIDNL